MSIHVEPSVATGARRRRAEPVREPAAAAGAGAAAASGLQLQRPRPAHGRRHPRHAHRRLRPHPPAAVPVRGARPGQPDPGRPPLLRQEERPPRARRVRARRAAGYHVPRPQGGRRRRRWRRVVGVGGCGGLRGVPVGARGRREGARAAGLRPRLPRRLRRRVAAVPDHVSGVPGRGAAQGDGGNRRAPVAASGVDRCGGGHVGRDRGRRRRRGDRGRAPHVRAGLRSTVRCRRVESAKTTVHLISPCLVCACIYTNHINTCN